eukprot:SAG31_NODE_841_length_11595_cov_3.739388_2_plen_388_part_00
MVRRYIKRVKSCIKAQAMLRGWMVRHEYGKALRQARKDPRNRPEKQTNEDIYQEIEMNPLLGASDANSSRVGSIVGAVGGIGQELATFRQTDRGPEKKAKKVIIDGKAGSDQRFWQPNKDSDCRYKHKDSKELIDIERDRAGGAWLLPEYRVDDLEWCETGRREVLCELEGAFEIAEDTQRPQLLFPPRFITEELSRGLDVGDDAIGFFGGEPKSTKETSGFVKILVRIIDETSPEITASGSCKPTAYVTSDIMHVPSQPYNIVAGANERLTVTVGRAKSKDTSSAVGDKRDPSTFTDLKGNRYNLHRLSNEIANSHLYGYNESALTSLAATPTGRQFLNDKLKTDSFFHKILTSGFVPSMFFDIPHILVLLRVSFFDIPTLPLCMW